MCIMQTRFVFSRHVNMCRTMDEYATILLAIVDYDEEEECIYVQKNQKFVLARNETPTQKVGAQRGRFLVRSLTH